MPQDISQFLTGSGKLKPFGETSYPPTEKQLPYYRAVLGGTGFPYPKQTSYNPQITPEGNMIIGEYNPLSNIIGEVGNDPQLLSHELTHALQHYGHVPFAPTKRKPFEPPSAGEYDYGGIEALRRLYAKRKLSPKQFTQEAQANMVGDWASRWATGWGPLSQEQVQLYAPFVQAIKTAAVQGQKSLDEPSYRQMLNILLSKYTPGIAGSLRKHRLLSEQQ